MHYLDHNATSPLRPAALERMLPWLSRPANPSSVHLAGQEARAALDDARVQLAELVGCSHGEIVFTSGGTESDNLALRGLVGPGGRLVTTSVEHPAVRETARALATMGAQWVELGVDAEGRLDWAAAEREIRPGTSLVSAIWANHETGVVADVERLSALCRDRGVPLHLDAVQAVGKLPIDVARLPVDLVSMSAHKVGGPVGIGALFVRRGLRLRALLAGGAQEGGLRPGTESVALAVGFAEAAARAEEGREALVASACGWWKALREATCVIEGARVTAPDAPRLWTTFHACFRGIEGEALVMALDLAGIRVSSGSACASGSTEPSPVLRAMGVPPEWARGALRASFGHSTTEADVRALADALGRIVPRLRASGSRV